MKIRSLSITNCSAWAQLLEFRFNNKFRKYINFFKYWNMIAICYIISVCNAFNFSKAFLQTRCEFICPTFYWGAIQGMVDIVFLLPLFSFLIEKFHYLNAKIMTNLLSVRIPRHILYTFV